MTEHEHDMVTTLCARISEEKDPVAFTKLVIKLNALFEKLATQRARRIGFESEN